MPAPSSGSAPARTWRSSGSAPSPTTRALLVPRVSPQAHNQLLALQRDRGDRQPPVRRAGLLQPRRDGRQDSAMERTALIRAIKALAAELPLDYVPPFRGNAVRVNDKRKKRGPRLPDRLQGPRRRRSSASTTSSSGWSSTPRATKCRRSVILGYFGDADAAAGECGNGATTAVPVRGPPPPGSGPAHRLTPRPAREVDPQGAVGRRPERRGGSARRWWPRCSSGRTPRRSASRGWRT